MLNQMLFRMSVRKYVLNNKSFKTLERANLKCFLYFYILQRNNKKWNINRTKKFFLAVKRRVAMKAIENKRKLKESVQLCITCKGK